MAMGIFDGNRGYQPLTRHALGKLRELAGQPYVMCLHINAGVQAKFEREGLAEFVDMPNTFKSPDARARAMRITLAGLRRLAQDVHP